MTIRSKVVHANLDSWFADTLGGAGNGRGDRMGVGMGTGDWAWQNRSAIRLSRPVEFAQIPNAAAITAFDVFVRASSEVFGIGAAVKFYWERGTTAFSENTESRRNFVATTGPDASEWPGPARVTANRGEYQGSPVNGDWLKTSMLAMGQWWYAHPEVTALVLVAVASDGAGGYAEATTARRCVFHTRESSSAPYAELKWNDNQAPNIPTDLSPADGTKIASSSGTSATISARHTDPEGNTATKYQAQWFPADTTDAQADDGSVAPTKNVTVTANTAHNALRSHTFTDLPARTTGEWRVRFYDGQWGPWSALRTATTAYKPSVVNVAVQQGTLTPLIYASITSLDPTGEYFTAYQFLVYQDPVAGQTITKWDSGKTTITGSPNRAEVQYGGSPLVFGTPYRLRIIGYNKDDVASDLTANFTFTQVEPTGAVIRIGAADGPVWGPGTKIDDLSPDLYVSDPTEGDVDQARVRIYGDQGVTLLHDSGVVEDTAAAYVVVSIPAGVLENGMNPHAEAAVRLSGNANIGPFSQKAQSHVNAKPGAPYPVTVSGGQTVLRSDGVWVTTDPTPDLLFPFRDVDLDLGYTESMERQEVEIRDDAEAAFGASPYIDDTDPSETFTSPALTVEETFDFRARVDDAAAARSDWSDRVYVKYSAAPTLTDVTPADTDIITDATPTFVGTYGHTGGVAEASRRLILYSGQTIIYDSGEQDPGDITVPAGTLADFNAVDLDYELISTNEDGLTVTVAGTITTDFTVPAALTGLVITQDDVEPALLIEWDASAEPNFESVNIYAKTEGGQFRLVTTVTDPDATAYMYRGAAHNRETVVRLTQSNGFAESEAIEGSATLEVDGYWIKRPSVATLLPSSTTDIKGRTQHGAGDTQVQIEQLVALGRTDKLLLTWGVTGYEGGFSLLTKDRALVDLLRSYKDNGLVVIVSTPYGASRYVRFTAVTDHDQPGGWIDVAVSYIEVSPDGQEF